MNNQWWKESVVYQIYPKSFMDSNGDGVGDIKGIIQKLPYLKTLGADVLWLSPVYKSPMDDGGYDISDYYSVDSIFGTNEELDDLIKQASAQGQKILMDLVVNHTSDEHEWFVEALSNPSSKYRDYYIFQEGFQGGPPNNWRSYFGSPAWEQVPNEPNMYYLHAFTKKQPDLNWENPNVREDIYKMVNYWLEKGLGGFRIDAILNIKKRIERGRFKPDGEDGLAFIGKWILNQPGIETWLSELNTRCFIPYNSMTVAEADVPEERLVEYIGENGYFSMVFDFSYTDIDVPATGEWFKETEWTIKELREAIFTSQLATQKSGWGALYLENHDQPRSVHKYIPAAHRNDHSKKLLAVLFMCLRGTPFIYQGQELGMENIMMTDMSDYDDIATHDQYERAVLSGMPKADAFEKMYDRSRDNSRTPMQWNTNKNAGFSESNQTWLKVNANYLQINAENQLEDVNSLFNFYRKLIYLRKNSGYKNVLVFGDFIPIVTEAKQVISYRRKTASDDIIVITNISEKSGEYTVDSQYQVLVLSNDKEVVLQEGILSMTPFGCYIFSKNKRENFDKGGE